MREDIEMKRISPQDLEEIIELDVVNRGGHSVIDGTQREETLFNIWARGMDSECRRLNIPPNWIKDSFNWGPHPWPISMTDLLKSRIADCGAYQDLATRTIKLRGAEAFPVQVFLEFPNEPHSGWSGLWRSAGLDYHWGNGKIAYHELTGILQENNQLQLYDPAEAIFPFPISTSRTHSAMIELRICSPYGEEESLRGREFTIQDSNGKLHEDIKIDQWYHLYSSQ